MIDSLLITVEWSYLNTDMRKFETSQKEESRAQSADSSKAGVSNSVPSKKILHWANIWFSEDEHFNAEFKWITNFVNPVWEPLV